VTTANPTHRFGLSVVVKALFKGKVQALFDLFRRGQAISFFRLLLLPIIIWVEVNAAELDNDLVESCRALRCVDNACLHAFGARYCEHMIHLFDFLREIQTQNFESMCFGFDVKCVAVSGVVTRECRRSEIHVGLGCLR
jgi:hypothetical protein